MTIKSIDLQVMLPKAAEVSRVQNNLQQQNQNQQQQFSSELQHQVQQKERQVSNSTGPQQGKILPDQEGQKKKKDDNTPGKREKKSASKSEQEITVSSQVGKRIDIRV